MKKENKELARKKREKARKRLQMRSTVLKWSAIVLVAAVIIFAIGTAVYAQLTKTKASSDYSAYLNEDGSITGYSPESDLELVDYEAMTVPASEVTIDDETLQTEIDTRMSGYTELVTDETRAIASGDKVNIDYVGYVQGEAFEGGSTEGAGTDLTIGSGTYIDDFEDQLIGKTPGSTLTVAVTFPEEYSNNPDMAGLDAEFEVTINGIYVQSELTDEFVVTNFSAYGDTVDSFKEALRLELQNAKVSDYIAAYIVDQSEVIQYPADYLKHLKSIVRYEDEQMMESYNSFYMAYSGQTVYENVYQYAQVESLSEYEDRLLENAESMAKTFMVNQAIAEKMGITAGQEEKEEIITTWGFTAEQYEEAVTEYGEQYILVNAVGKKVLNTLVQQAIIQ